MTSYSFMSDQGWRVTEYRPFSPSYAVLHTPGLNEQRKADYATALYSHSETPSLAPDEDSSGDLLKTLTGQQLKFDYFSEDLLKQLLKERVTIRDRNRAAIQGRLSDLSGEIYGTVILKTPDGDKRRQGLEKTRMDLEKQLRDEDVTLWKDAVELRRELIIAAKKYEGTKLRTGLFAMPLTQDDQYKIEGYGNFSG